MLPLLDIVGKSCASEREEPEVELGPVDGGDTVSEGELGVSAGGLKNLGGGGGGEIMEPRLEEEDLRGGVLDSAT